MKFIKNERGYALVTVLLLVTVFMIVFLSFIGQAFSSTKQNQVVEKKTHSVAAAEMGISFYQVAIQDMYESNQNVVRDHVRGIMQQPSSVTPDFRREAAKKMAELLRTNVPTIAVPLNAPFQISNFTADIDHTDPSSYLIAISFDINGSAEGKTTKLSADMSIDLSSINNLSSSGPSSSYVLPNFNSIQPPQNGCTSFIDGCNEILVGNGYETPKINGTGLSGKTIYSTGSITVNSNANNSLNLTIHADGPVTVDDNMNSSSTLTLETKSSATFGGQLKLYTSSSLLIGEDLKNFEGGIPGQNGNHFYLFNSNVYVERDAILNKLSIDTTSKMCVKRNLTAYSVTSDSKNLFVLGTVTINGQPTSTYTVDSATFYSNCGKFIPGEFDINWGDHIDTELNDVEY